MQTANRTASLTPDDLLGLKTVGDAQIKGWQLQIDRDVAPEVMRLFKLVHLDRFVLGTQTRDGGGPAPK